MWRSTPLLRSTTGVIARPRLEGMGYLDAGRGPDVSQLSLIFQMLMIVPSLPQAHLPAHSCTQERSEGHQVQSKHFPLYQHTLSTPCAYAFAVTNCFPKELLPLRGNNSRQFISGQRVTTNILGKRLRWRRPDHTVTLPVVVACGGAECRRNWRGWELGFWGAGDWPCWFPWYLLSSAPLGRGAETPPPSGAIHFVYDCVNICCRTAYPARGDTTAKRVVRLGRHQAPVLATRTKSHRQRSGRNVTAPPTPS